MWTFPLGSYPTYALGLSFPSINAFSSSRVTTSSAFLITSSSLSKRYHHPSRGEGMYNAFGSSGLKAKC